MQGFHAVMDHGESSFGNVQHIGGLPADILGDRDDSPAPAKPRQCAEIIDQPECPGIPFGMKQEIQIVQGDNIPEAMLPEGGGIHRMMHDLASVTRCKQRGMKLLPEMGPATRPVLKGSRHQRDIRQITPGRNTRKSGVGKHDEGQIIRFMEDGIEKLEGGRLSSRRLRRPGEASVKCDSEHGMGR